MHCSDTDEPDDCSGDVTLTRLLKQKTSTVHTYASSPVSCASQNLHNLLDNRNNALDLSSRSTTSSDENTAQALKTAHRQPQHGAPLRPPPLLACMEIALVSRTNLRPNTNVRLQDSRKRMELPSQPSIGNDIDVDNVRSGQKSCLTNFVANKRLKLIPIKLEQKEEETIISSDQKLFLEAAAALSNTTMRTRTTSIRHHTPKAALAPPPYTLPTRSMIAKVLT